MIFVLFLSAQDKMNGFLLCQYISEKALSESLLFLKEAIMRFIFSGQSFIHEPPTSDPLEALPKSYFRIRLKEKRLPLVPAVSILSPPQTLIATFLSQSLYQTELINYIHSTNILSTNICLLSERKNVLLSEGCCNKLPQAENKEMCCLTVLEPEVQNQGVGRLVPSGNHEERTVSSPLPASRGCWQSWAATGL